MGFFGQRASAATTLSSVTDISGLQLWLDSTKGLFDATTGGNAVTTNGSSVARWEDQSGNGRHATQGTANNRPTLSTSTQNSKDGLTFDGDNDSMSISSFACPTSFTVFAVVKSETASQKDFSRVIEHGTNDGWAIIFTGTPKTYRFQFAGASNIDTTVSAGTLTRLLEYASRANAIFSSTTRAQGFLVNNANEKTDTNTRTPSTPLSFYLTTYGTTGGTYAGNMKLFEILYWNKLLTDAERDFVRDYLNTKWAVY